MAKKMEIEVDLKTNVEPSIKLLKELRLQLKGIEAGTDAYNKVSARIKDVEDSLENAKAGAASFKDQLEAAPGPIGTLFQGMRKLEIATSSFGAALKATGIGLLVGLVGGIAAAFSQTEEAGKKLEPLMIGFQKIFNGIFRALEPVFNTLVELAISVMPTVTETFGKAYSMVASFLQGLGLLGKAVYKLITGDFTGAWETAKEAVTGAVDRYDEANKRFISGTKELTKKEKENIKERNDAAKKALDEKIKRMDTQDKLDKAQMDKMKAEALSLAKTEEEKLAIEKKFLDMAYQARMKDIEDKQKLYKKDSEEYKNLQIEKVTAETEYINSLTSLKDKEKDLNQKALQELYDIWEKENEKLTKKQQEADAERRGIRAVSIQSQIEELDRLNALSELDFEEDKKRLQEKRQLLEDAERNELSNTELTEFERTQIRDKYAKERKKITQDEIDAEKAAQAARFEIMGQTADVIGQFGNFLSQIAGKNKGIAKAGLILEQAAGISRIIINTAAANAKAVAASPLTFGQPWVGINTASAAISIASAIAATVKGINQINASDNEVQKGGEAKPNMGRNYAVGGLIEGPRHAQGGVMIEAEGGEAVMTRGAVTMFAPLLSTLNQMGGGTSFGIGSVGGSRPDAPAVENPAMSQMAPIIKAYVVSNDLTTEAEKQARLKDLSTL